MILLKFQQWIFRHLDFVLFQQLQLNSIISLIVLSVHMSGYFFSFPFIFAIYRRIFFRLCFSLSSSIFNSLKGLRIKRSYCNWHCRSDLYNDDELSRFKLYLPMVCYTIVQKKNRNFNNNSINFLVGIRELLRKDGENGQLLAKFSLCSFQFHFSVDVLRWFLSLILAQNQCFLFFKRISLTWMINGKFFDKISLVRNRKKNFLSIFLTDPKEIENNNIIFIVLWEYLRFILFLIPIALIQDPALNQSGSFSASANSIGVAINASADNFNVSFSFPFLLRKL